MPYNSETETFYQAPATVVDSTPDGDTVQEGFDDRLTPALAGIYADFNLLKADGMISVGIPATTTARGIGRVATSADLVDGATINNGPAFLAAGVHTSVAAAAGKIPVTDADGSVNNLCGARYATCATAAATAAKVADIANFQLVKGSRVFVTFSNTNTVAGALTLDINGTGAKAVYNELGSVSASNMATWMTGVPIEFMYDGAKWRYQTPDAVGNAMGQYAHIRDVKPTNTNGGTTSAAAWQTRDLNTVVKNNIGAVLNASNQVVLQPGTYKIVARIPGAACNRMRTALYSVTTSSYLLYSPSCYSDYSYPSSVYAVVEGEITLTVATTLELRMWCQTGLATNGMGYASNIPGVPEIYSELFAWKM